MNHPLHEHFQSQWPDVEAAWRTWGERLAVQTRAATRWIVDLAGVGPGMTILDVASGVADPALTLLAAVAPDGQVVATDLVAPALTQLAENATRLGFGGLRTVCAPMEALPFATGSFDAATCRLGLMFATDLARALRELARVLKPGGRAACVVWGSPLQALFQATLALIPGFERLCAGAPDRPGPFRFSSPGALGGAMRRAGFANVREETRRHPWPFPGSAREMWQAFIELSGAELHGAVTAEVEAQVLEALTLHEQGGVVDPGAVLVGCVGVSEERWTSDREH